MTESQLKEKVGCKINLDGKVFEVVGWKIVPTARFSACCYVCRNAKLECRDIDAKAFPNDSEAWILQ